MARLDALQQKLDLVPEWSKLGLRRVEEDANLRAGLDIEELRAALDMGINMEARKQRGAVNRVRRDLEAAGDNDAEAVRTAWREYARIEAESEDIFRVCLEFVGGLAIRDNDLDQHILRVADELVRNCALTSIGQKYLSFTVPAQQEQEAMKRIMGRIIRLRFPEWTIWSLPFTAHEYGHVVMEELMERSNDLESSVKALVKEWNEQALTEESSEQALAEERNEHHLYEILADTFATYTMGPAYACAAISLRLRPSAAYTDQGNQLADAKRAYTILSMLGRMNDAANKGLMGRDPYKETVIELLEKRWNRALEQIMPPGELRSTDTDRLEKLVDAIWENLPFTILPTALYSRDGSGWQLAQQWADVWWKQLNNNQDLSIPDLSGTNQRHELRDALNAAWLCRIQSEQDKVRHITKAAYELCNEIISNRRPPGSGRRRSPRVPIG